MRFDENKSGMRLLNKEGRIDNAMILVVAKSGSGKTVFCENLAQEYFDVGRSVVIVLGDPKRQEEWMFNSLMPTDITHLNELRKTARVPKPIPCCQYEPFVETIPRGNLPKINFFTFDISKFSKTEFQAIVETDSDSEVVRLMCSSAKALRPSEGIYAFMDRIKNQIGKEQSTAVADPNAFFVKSSLGNRRSEGDIASYMQPYDKQILASANCPHNLDFESIINDNSQYHVFCISDWFQDDKTRDLITLFLLNGFMKVQSKAKKPVLFVLPEVRTLCSAGSVGYKKWLSSGVKRAMSLGRASGKGMSFLLDSQNFAGIDAEVKASATISFFGELGSPADIMTVTKAYGLNAEMKKYLSKMEEDYSFLCSLMAQPDKTFFFKPFFPTGGHCEERYSWYEEVKKQKPLEQQDYLELKKEMKIRYKEEFDLYKKKALEEKKKADDKIETNARKRRVITTAKYLKQGMSVDEISVELGIAISTVDTYLPEAKALLKKQGADVSKMGKPSKPKQKAVTNKPMINLVCRDKAQANKDGVKCSIRMLAERYEISKTSVERILKQNLKIWEDENEPTQQD